MARIDSDSNYPPAAIAHGQEMLAEMADGGTGKVTATSILTLIDGKVSTGAMNAALADKADLVGGVVPSSQMPSIAVMDRVPVADEAARLALTSAEVQPGDVAVQADTATTWLLIAPDPSDAASWKPIDQSDAVESVNGQTGTVVLGKGDIGLGNVSNTAPADLPISTATQAALDGKLAPSDLPGGDPAQVLTTADIDGSGERGVQAHSDVLDDLAEDDGVLSTGWRNIASLLHSNWELDESGNYLHLARFGKTVHLAGSISPAEAIWGASRVGNNIVLNTGALPSGFQIRRAGTVFGTAARQTNGSLGFLWAPTIARIDIRMVVETSTWADGDSVQLSASWPTNDAWPATLPGTSA